jgi:hypothetical protein
MGFGRTIDLAFVGPRWLGPTFQGGLQVLLAVLLANPLHGGQAHFQAAGNLAITPAGTPTTFSRIRTRRSARSPKIATSGAESM